MIIKIPLTGTWLGGTSGDPEDPIRPINFNHLLPASCRNFSWQMLAFDIARGVGTLEVLFEPQLKPDETMETPEEFQATRKMGEAALTNLLSKNTAKNLHELSKEPPIKRASKPK